MGCTHSRGLAGASRPTNLPLSHLKTKSAKVSPFQLRPTAAPQTVSSSRELPLPNAEKDSGGSAREDSLLGSEERLSASPQNTSAVSAGFPRENAEPQASPLEPGGDTTPGRTTGDTGASRKGEDADVSQAEAVAEKRQEDNGEQALTAARVSHGARVALPSPCQAPLTPSGADAEAQSPSRADQGSPFSGASRWLRPAFPSPARRKKDKERKGRVTTRRRASKNGLAPVSQNQLFRYRFRRKKTRTRGGGCSEPDARAAPVADGASKSSSFSVGPTRGEASPPVASPHARCPRCGRDFPAPDSPFAHTGAQHGRELTQATPREPVAAERVAPPMSPAERASHAPAHAEGQGLGHRLLSPKRHRPYFDRVRPAGTRSAQDSALRPGGEAPFAFGGGTFAIRDAPGGRQPAKGKLARPPNHRSSVDPKTHEKQGHATPVVNGAPDASPRKGRHARSPGSEGARPCCACGWPGPQGPQAAAQSDSKGTHRATEPRGRPRADHRSRRGPEEDVSSSDLSVPPEFVMADPLSFFNSLTHTPLFTSRIKTKVKLEQVYDVSNHVLGTGISGAVRIGHHRQSRRQVAIKTLCLSAMAPKRTLMLYNEVAIYLQVDHPNICKLLEVFVDDGEERKPAAESPRLAGNRERAESAEARGDSRSLVGSSPVHAVGKTGDVRTPVSSEGTPLRAEDLKSEEQDDREERKERRGSCMSRTSISSDEKGHKRIHLVMELCTGKELYDRLARKKRYSEKDAGRVTRQMLSAINYCHQRHICHRDLKLENWVFRDDSDDAPLKLIDFGFSRIFHPGVRMTAMHGTVYYVAPEVMDGKYNEKCDLWSIGVIVYMLLSGSPPFTGHGDQEILIKIRRCKYNMDGPRWRGISEQAKHFIASLLRRNPEERPSAEEALKHPWLVAAEKEALADTEIDVSVLKSMQRFAACSAIKRASLALIAMSMNAQQLDDLERLFRKIDIDNSGCIKMDRMVAVLVTFLDVPRDEALRIFQRIDQTRAEEINYSEFLAATLQTRIALNQQLIREAFERFDVDNSGHISLENLRYVLGDSYDSLSVEEILRQCDRKQNGVIEFDEFMLALTGDESGVLESGNSMDLVAQGAALTAQVSRNMSELADAVLAKRFTDSSSSSSADLHGLGVEHACTPPNSSRDASTMPK
ncbi:calcium-dependent protein kinase CDPK4 [Toxoplasma gondii VAND]|uniref:Calcium-dependent protein kinase CDPK4 n=2 Tax=Toxoplasma gondii TaxID=5811 RepID=A0A3R8A3V9_TOXGO|nr:calcium-dependent protein kinase CDPK4 [Toxoplasma gondii VAND]RQX66998.1 calcium-dependent protein kinase CDPK4 [Toxoplasma gondii CAST]